MKNPPRNLHRNKLQRRCCSCSSSLNLFYLILACALLFGFANLLAGRKDLSEFQVRKQQYWTIPHVPKEGTAVSSVTTTKSKPSQSYPKNTGDIQLQHHSGNNPSRPEGRVPKYNGDVQITHSDSNVTGATGNENNHLGRVSTNSEPSHHACDGYDGIFLISQGDAGGAAGTVFFQFVIGQILYAEKYNLKPFVYLNNISYVIYDSVVHGQGPGVHIRAISGRNASHIVRPNGHWRDRVPGPPEKVGPVEPKDFYLEGTGVWEHYFEPVSDFKPGDKSCESKPLVQMDMFLITPGIHGFAEWAPRCWRYQYAPDYVTKPHIPIHEWLEPQRITANSVINKYFRFKRFIMEAANKANPGCSEEFPCLGLHIRQSDKAAGRRQIQTYEFLPYAVAFVRAGGKAIYLATDSTKVLDEIHSQWPAYIQDKIRTIGNNVVRSTNESAVFDIAAHIHDRTNREILIEILALAKCQFIVHGLSAVTESSIWINVDLHDRSVDLEDTDHMSPIVFFTLVQMILRNKQPRDHWPSRRKMHQWWKEAPIDALHYQKEPTHEACSGYDGILLISSVGPKDTAGVAFFNSILNQLLYAEKHNLKPWIHLGNESRFIYDEDIHSQGYGATMEFLDGFGVSIEYDINNAAGIYPGKPEQRQAQSTIKLFQVSGNGIWNSYFQPVSEDLRAGDNSCRQLPLIRMETQLISPGLSVWCPWCIRAWRYDGVPSHVWKPPDMKLKDWYEPMRKKGHEIVNKYYDFLPYMKSRANEVNPTKDANNATIPCLAVHFRNAFKSGKHRTLVKAKEFQEYLEAFVRAGGNSIYVASDSHRVIELLTSGEDFPDSIQQMIKLQGRYVVRSSGGKKNKWLVHELEKHHRVNSEVLVDILAMSKCQLLLHGFSTTSEAVFYLNPKLHDASVNMEDPDRPTPEAFEGLARSILQKYQRNEAIQPQKGTTYPISRRRVSNTTVLWRNSKRKCKQNSIIYLAQKKHSTYGRDSYAILKESMDLMFKNYLSLGQHRDNTDIFIFHTGDFNATDLAEIESRFGPDYYGIVRLVDLSGSQYWHRPQWHLNDDPNKNWYAYPLFSEGYRHMMRWFAIGLWDFFGNYNQETGCEYRYLFRLDEDSYLHSPIGYDIFDFMRSNSFVYGFRLCAYEMKVTNRIQKVFYKKKGDSFQPIREVDLNMCGFYNNFFVADIEHFRSPEVQEFLRIVDRQGLIYRRRLGDLMIHSLSVYFFAPPERVHRFLDFTYQHSTRNQTSGCVVWGGIEAGYEDPEAETTLERYYQEQVIKLNCPCNATFLAEADLSPTYAHIPAELRGRVFLHSFMSGNVEKPGKGLLSG